MSFEQDVSNIVAETERLRSYGIAADERLDNLNMAMTAIAEGFDVSADAFALTGLVRGLAA